MLQIVVRIDAPAMLTIGVKEQIAAALEQFGDVRVVDVKELGKVEQMTMPGV